MHKAERPNNYFFNTFTHIQAEQVKKGVILCPNLVRNTPDFEHSRVHFKVE